MILYRHPLNQLTPPDKVGSTMLLHQTGVDLATSVTLTFPKLNAVSFCKLAVYHGFIGIRIDCLHRHTN